MFIHTFDKISTQLKTLSFQLHFLLLKYLYKEKSESQRTKNLHFLTSIHFSNPIKAMILQTTINSFTFSSQPISRNSLFFKNLTFFTSPLLPKSFLPSLDYRFYLGNKRSSLSVSSAKTGSKTIHATLLEAPVLWAGRVCVFYALLKAGLAGSPSNPLVSGILVFFYIKMGYGCLLFSFMWGSVVFESLVLICNV